MDLYKKVSKEVTEFYLQEGQKCLKDRGENLPYELTLLTGSLMEDYLHDQQLIREFATLNRHIILEELVKGMKWKTEDRIECSHNYIEFDSGWFVDISVIPEAKKICKEQDIRFERFHCGGKGG